MRSAKPVLVIVNVLAVATLVCLQALPAVAAAEGSFQRTLSVSGPVRMDR